MNDLRRTKGGNPRTCVVCGGDLQFKRVSRSTNGPDLDGLDDGSVTDWTERQVLLSIHCPRCELVYRVSNQDE